MRQQTDGNPTQVQPSSIKQKGEQPSSYIWFESSQVSPASWLPLLQVTGGGTADSTLKSNKIKDKNRIDYVNWRI